MSNGDDEVIICCVLGVCCSPAAQLAALTKVYVKAGVPKKHAVAAAHRTQDLFTESNFKAAIAARDKAAGV